ncbi:flavoprotein [Desulfosporosinus fructosivorans]|uniref:Flavoprotein n=1 Tax=Desulfosporosinus fructosivorans TaxID=2018669 RepID=A0A4Z0QX18_9FIRM|nr:flavoprotein [Desulfosporosinus fructosivorans]TGE35054.1 flavoprotein [Desulfosporosinus fructosivorans]
MNEELINQIVSRILSEPAFQALLHGNKDGNSAELKAVKPDALVLLNYVPDFERVLTATQQQFGSDYTLSILPSDQTNMSKPKLPEGMSWITPQDALSKSNWQKIILPACSPNTLAKAALGIRDNPISETIGRGITQGTSILLVTEYLGFTAQTPKAYRALYEGYLQTVQAYGVVVSTTLGEGCTSTLNKDKGRTSSVGDSLITDKGTVQSSLYPTVTHARQSNQASLFDQRLAINEQRKPSTEQSAPNREEIRFDKKFLGDKQVYGIPEGSIVLVKRGTVISPLARDTMKSRRIELRQEKEEGRR